MAEIPENNVDPERNTLLKDPQRKRQWTFMAQSKSGGGFHDCHRNSVNLPDVFMGTEAEADELAASHSNIVDRWFPILIGY